MFGRVTWIPASAGMTVPAFAGMTANGVVQRSMLAANDGAVADSVTNPNIHLLISTPVLEARVDSARVASESGDTVRVVVFSTPPNLEGLPDSIREARMSDVAFLETRPRLTDYDTVVVVKENHQWRGYRRPLPGRIPADSGGVRGSGFEPRIESQQGSPQQEDSSAEQERAGREKDERVHDALRMLRKPPLELMDHV